MATTNERVAVLETKVDELKEDVTLMRKENREDHAMVMDALRSVHKVIGRVEDKVDRHLVWHAEGKDGNVPRGSKGLQPKG